MTNPSLSDEMLEALGVAREALGASIEIPDADADIAAGASWRQTTAAGLTALQTLLATAVFDRIPDDAFRPARVWVSAARAHRYVVKLRFEGEDQVTTRSASGAGELSAATDELDPTIHIVDIEHVEATSLLRPDGSGVVLQRGPSGPVVIVVRARPLAIAPLAQLDAPIALWCAQCPDAWLAQAVLARATGGHSWDIVAAAGMLGRLVDVNNPSTARNVLEAMRTGSPDSTLDTIRVARRWIRQLKANELDTIADLAIAKADRLEDVLDSMLEENESIATSTRQLFIGRDDLEGVRTLLAEVDRAGDIDVVLHSLDERATAWVLETRSERIRQDERLRRVASGNEWVWWSGSPPDAMT